MGGEQSAQPNQLEFLNCLLEQDHNADHKYWVQLMENAFDRNTLHVPNSVFLNEIANKFPANFINLVLASVHEVCSLEGEENNLSPEQLNQLDLALRLFTSCASVMISNPKISPIFENLDKETFEEMLKISNKQLEKLKEHSKKSEKKQTQTETEPKSEKANAETDSNNQVVDPNASQKVPQKAKKAVVAENGQTQNSTAAKKKKKPAASPAPETQQNTEQATQPKKKKVQQQPTEQAATQNSTNTTPKRKKSAPAQPTTPTQATPEQPKKKTQQQQTEQAATQVSTNTQPKRKKSAPAQPATPTQATTQEPQKKTQQQQTEQATTEQSPQPKKKKVQQQPTEQQATQIATTTQPKRKKSASVQPSTPTQTTEQKPKQKKVQQQQTEQQPETPAQATTEQKPKKKKAQQQSEQPESQTAQPKTKKLVPASEQPNQSQEDDATQQKPKKKVSIEQAQVQEPTKETKKKNAAVNRAKSPQPTKNQPIEAAETSASNRAQSPQPQRTKRDPEQKKFLSRHRAMRTHDGHVINDFTKAVLALLYKEGVTIEKRPESKKSDSEKKEEQLHKHYWIQGGEMAHLSEFNKTREELLRALLIISSLHVFSPNMVRSHPEVTSQFLDELPIDDFINSTCRVTFRYMNDGQTAPDDVRRLTSVSLALLIRLFTNKRFQEEITKIHPQILLSGIYTPYKPDTKAPNLPLFQPLDPLAKESLSFLYICALFQKNFVPLLTKRNYSNLFLFHLIWAAQLYFEKEGVNYIHSIILSTILLIVADPKAAEKLNEELDQSLQMKDCKFQPTQNGTITYGDLLLEVLLNFCQRESFLPSLICVFHMIAPYANTFSIPTATRTMHVFERIQNANKSYISLFLEVFATIVQQKDNSQNGFCALIVSKGGLFKNIQPATASMTKSLPVIMTYVKKGIAMIKKQNKPTMSVDEIAEVLAKINTEKLFPTPQLFVKHPHIFGGEIEKTWNQWADLIFQFICQDEVQSIKNLRNKVLETP